MTIPNHLHGNEWADDAIQLISDARRKAANGGHDYAALHVGEATAAALLAVAHELRTNTEAIQDNGATALAQQQAAHNAEAFRDEITRGLTPADMARDLATPNPAHITDHDIEALAHDLWKADPGNRSAARTFQEDYGTAQDRYRALARAALGLTDAPKDDKDGRRP